LEVHFDEVDDIDAKLLEHDFLEKEKEKMVYMVENEEVEKLDIDHSECTCEVLDGVDEKGHAYHEPMKTKKVNIGMTVEPKEAIIGDYCSDSKVAKIIKLLRDFQDLFPRAYHELKGVHESLGKMKIKLKEGVHPVRKRPYMVNPNMCIKFKKEIDNMLESGINDPVEESKWVSPVLINIKKYGRIWIFLDYMEMNVACLIDPFPTPFTEEILEGVARCEIYSFTDEFSGYHQ
ncbi:hypothetical protein KI387_011163, partial [Taxus chinensis]